MRTERLAQADRLKAVGIYLVVFLAAGWVVQRQFPPPTDLSGLWFYAGVAALLLGSLLDEPFYSTPADALINGVAVALVVVGLSGSGGAVIDASTLVAGRLLFALYAAVVIVAATLAISLKDQPGRPREIAQWSARIARGLGAAGVIYSVVYFATAFAAFANSAGAVAFLYLAWIVTFHVRPVERLLKMLSKVSRTNAEVGVVERVVDPGIVVARIRRGVHLEVGNRVSLGNPPVDGTVVSITRLLDEARARVSLAGAASVADGSGIRLAAMPDAPALAGFTTVGTTLSELHVELVANAVALQLEIGRLLLANVSDRETLFQVVSAEIEDAPDRGYARTPTTLVAAKLGRWSERRSTFEPEPWMPASGSSVTVVTPVVAAFDPTYLGHVPGTSYGVALRVHQSVTHNTAILGILGVGKTHVAWELIHRMLAEGIKVVVLDITDRYAPHFADLCPPTTQRDHEEAVTAAIAPRLNDATMRGDESGNVPDFDPAIRDLIRRFVDGPGRLMILNPANFAVSRMEMRPSFNNPNRALMLTRLSMVEITRKVAESVLEIVQALAQPEDDRARICLVLEEAHSLVPEWNSTTQDADREAVNGTTRALLQGRKYGYGCLLITQRTANVTKSILNQCNTILGMRVYDATGMGFLENYIGLTYSRVLASLKYREAVFYGRGSSCDAPIVIRLNDADEFKKGFWAEAVGAVPVTPLFADLARAPVAAPTAEAAIAEVDEGVEDDNTGDGADNEDDEIELDEYHQGDDEVEPERDVPR